MNSHTKKILYVDLKKQQAEVKFHDDLKGFVGGVGLGAKLLLKEELDSPIVFAVGPLNGFFPYASKTSVLFKTDKLHDLYFGGSLSWRIRFTGLDAIVLHGRAKEPLVVDIADEKVTFRPFSEDLGNLGLPGKRSTIDLTETSVLVDGYFEVSGKALHQKLINKQVKSVVVTGTQTFKIENEEKYLEIYNEIVGKVGDLTVEKGGFPSCSGCLVGCNKSKVGEVSGDVLVHSLVACSYAQPVYSDVNTVFACLNVLGYPYTHEDIENFPKLVYDVLEELESK